MFVVQHKRMFFWITGIILVSAVGAIVAWGLPLGIDFTGGSLVQVEYSVDRPVVSEIEKQIEPVAIGAVSVRAVGDSGMAIRSRVLTPVEHDALITALGGGASSTKVIETGHTTVGPALGSQFTDKALTALLAVALVIMLYVAFVFRKVSRPVPSWGYGIITVTMLVIDLTVAAGFFAAYAHLTGAEVDSLFIVALLSLLGYSVNDTIVIFDRIREHLLRKMRENSKETLEETIGASISETLARSINTSLTVALTLIALLVFGPESTRTFAIVLLVGVVAGTFSSVCRSAPLLIPIAARFGRATK